MIENLQSSATLQNGLEMPWFGLGVSGTRDTRKAVLWALEAGYRSIDTATTYHNEAQVGLAIQESDVPRSDIFVTTKISNGDQRGGRTLQGFEESLDALQMDYVDLYLVHWPVPGRYKQTWREMENIYESGRAKAIGVSNFTVAHLQDLLPETTILPVVNQIEFHPFLQSPELVVFCEANHIQVEAWSPIMRGDVLKVKELRDIGAKYGKNAVQVTLRWMLQRAIVAIPKSDNHQRIINNADVFDFELTAEEVALINSLDRNKRTGPDPDNFNF